MPRALQRLAACWGNGQFGRLGLGSQDSELFPRVIPQLLGVMSVAAGGAHTAVVTGEGASDALQLSAWEGWQGRVCCGPDVGAAAPTARGSCWLRARARLTHHRGGVSTPLQQLPPRLAYLRLQHAHPTAEAGGLWTFGINNHGQLGHSEDHRHVEVGVRSGLLEVGLRVSHTVPAAGVDVC